MRTLVTTRGAFHEPTVKTIHDHLEKCHQEGFWMDIENPDKDDLTILDKAFKFHPLTLEDIKHGNQRPKLEEYKGYSFMVLFQAILEERDDRVRGVLPLPGERLPGDCPQAQGAEAE